MNNNILLPTESICNLDTSGRFRMRTGRALSVNNSLCHGVCNYNCKLCGVNKPTYKGPRKLQPEKVTTALIQRIEEAAHQGMKFRIITNSGDGEPTLHPEFGMRMDMFGKMVRNWSAPEPAPELTLVTNGSNLLNTDVTDALARNPVTVNISFPSATPEHYGELMFCDPPRGKNAMKVVLQGIDRLLSLHAKGLINRICFHISPPDREIIREDFDNTVKVLTNAAHTNGVNKVELVMFPGTSNRSGLIRNTIASTDFYTDLFRKYHRSRINDVSVHMTTVLRRFFKHKNEILDLIRSFNYPCIWNGNFFIAPDGSSICCNDQAVRNPLGNIMDNNLHTLMRFKETYLPNAVCRGCDQQPHKMKGSLTAVFLNITGRIRLKTAKAKNGLQFLTSAHKKDRQFAEDRNTSDTLSAHIHQSDRSDNLCSLVKKASTVAREINNSTNITQNSEFSKESENNISETDTGLESPRVELALQQEDMLAAYKLLYNQYLSYGYMSENTNNVRASLWNTLPETYTVVAKKQGKVVGTVTYIVDSEQGLPMDEFASEALGDLRKKKRILCEVSGLAIEKKQANSQTLMDMFQYGLVLMRHFIGATDYVITVNPRHEKFYKRLLCFKQIASPKSCHHVNNAPGIPMRLDLATLPNVYRNKYGLKQTARNMYYFFFQKNQAHLVARIDRELEGRRKVYTMDFLNGVFLSCTSVLDNPDDYTVFCRQWTPVWIDQQEIKCAG